MEKIYIVHGWTYSLSAWDECLAQLRALGYDPIMLKVPGLTADSEKVWTLDEYVTWLNSELPAQGPITLIGHSNGGRISLALAEKFPDRIANLILIDAAGIFHNGLFIRLKRAVFGGAARVGKKLTTSVAIQKIFYRLILAKDYVEAPRNMKETMKNMISVDLRAGFPNIKSKTLIIWGDQDKATPIGDAYIMERGIQGSKLVVLRGIGHSPHKAEPVRVAQEIATWLRGK